MLAATGFKSTGDHTAFDNGVENRDTLTPKATGLSYFKESLIIAERFLGVHIYSGLMIKDNMKDGERVLYEIANAAQKMSNAAWDNTGSVSFFVEILSKYLYFFEKGNPQITGTAIQSLIELITPEMQSDNSTPDPAADAFLSRTLGYIQFQKQKGGANGFGDDTTVIFTELYDMTVQLKHSMSKFSAFDWAIAMFSTLVRMGKILCYS
ncbi:hypothetical protein D5086_014925 [Populus alba]|uniref:Uncharacterized protein n=1 Tax=Populus alba TaxID=43335 RepID=A0ACC4BZD4_POPAL